MVYANLPDNMLALIKETGIIRVEQLERFFAEAAGDDYGVKYYVEQFTKQRLLDYVVPGESMLKWHYDNLLTEAEMHLRLISFWPVASMGSGNVREVTVSRYPMQFEVIMSDNTCCDITYCKDIQTGFLAQKMRERYRLPGNEDDTNHIAVVSNLETGKRLKDAGFDCFCILDKKNLPVYYEL